MNNNDIAAEWFAFAERDLESARFLLQMLPTPFEIICYHCQQSAEKYLKGYIALNGGKLVKTHDLVLLNKTCRQYASDFKGIADDCIELVDYGVQVRYPSNTELTETDMVKAIKSAENIRGFILDKIERSG